MVTSISSVAVIGAGYMGGGIAQSLALAGLPVTIADVSAEATETAFARLIAEAQEFEDAGLYDGGATETIRANLRTAPSIEEAVADVDFVEEVVFESVEVKHDVLARISAAAREDAIIGSNTSTIPARVLATAVKNPERFLTVHFSNPAPFIPGVELVLGERTDEAVVPVVKELLAKADREAAIVADVPGFVLNRLQYVLLKEAMSIAEEGIASPEDIDTVVRTTFGFRLGFFGPFAIADQAGLDVYAGGFRTFEEAFGERLSTPALIQDAVAGDRRGVKNGKGLLKDYTPEQVKALVAHRNKAYSEMGRLVRSLGPSPA
ncbi:3-hydroxyacyl-CoA dehydrogenase family protein [Isoptericola sp. NPDC019693]|uniref:3-hydroxyacyl-CoA dehydrogenase family protein n=1 Tax=Isoptericola sp. NPDC019693 TaxID=3364009 RepID=UPI0037B840BF